MKEPKAPKGPATQSQFDLPLLGGEKATEHPNGASMASPSSFPKASVADFGFERRKAATDILLKDLFRTKVPVNRK